MPSSNKGTSEDEKFYDFDDAEMAGAAVGPFPTFNEQKRNGKLTMFRHGNMTNSVPKSGHSNEAFASSSGTYRVTPII